MCDQKVEQKVMESRTVPLFQLACHQSCPVNLRLRISFLLTYRLTVKLFTLFVESGLGQHAISFLKLCLGILSRLVLSGPSACFHLERSVIQTNKHVTLIPCYIVPWQPCGISVATRLIQNVCYHGASDKPMRWLALNRAYTILLQDILRDIVVTVP